MTTAGREIEGSGALRIDNESPLRHFVADFCENKIAVVALFVFVGVTLAALFAPLISIQNPYDLAQIDIMDGTMPPGSESASGSTYLLGTDDQGRDMVSAILYGLRISLGVGAISGLAAMLLGIFAGLTAAYMGGRIDLRPPCTIQCTSRPTAGAHPAPCRALDPMRTRRGSAIIEPARGG